MSYKRKTKDVYELWWNGEKVDSTEDWREAKYLKKEYDLAFGGGVTIIKKREVIK